MALERLKGRIQPIELMDEDKCYEILHLSKYYQSLNQDDRIKVLKQDLATRLEKSNEVVWKHYPIQKIEEIDDAKARIMAHAERIAHLPLYRDMQLVSSLLNDQMFIYKNYQEMVAYVTVVWYELDKFLLKVENERATLGDRVDELEQANARLLDENVRLIKQKEHEPVKALLPAIQTTFKAVDEKDYGTETAEHLPLHPPETEEKPEHTYSESEKILGNENTSEDFGESKIIASEHVEEEKSESAEEKKIDVSTMNRPVEIGSDRSISQNNSSKNEMSLNNSSKSEITLTEGTPILDKSEAFLGDKDDKQAFLDKLFSYSDITDSEKKTLALFLEKGRMDRKTFIQSFVAREGRPKVAEYHLLIFVKNGILTRTLKEGFKKQYFYELAPAWFDHLTAWVNYKKQTRRKAAIGGIK